MSPVRSMAFLFLLFLFTRCLIVSGQAQREIHWNAESLIAFNYQEDYKIHFHLVYGQKRHEIVAGFEFPVNSNPVYNYGFDAGYRFYPNKNRAAFDFFFQYLLQAGSRNLHSQSIIRGFSLQNMAGYGFNVYLNRSLYVKHSIAAGIENSWFGQTGDFSDLSLSAFLGVGIIIIKQ